MTLHMLVEEKQKPIPPEITVKENWGPLTVVTDANGRVYGEHMMLEGSAADFVEWLKPFDGVWVGEGSPTAQNFVVMHIKD